MNIIDFMDLKPLKLLIIQKTWIFSKILLFFIVKCKNPRPFSQIFTGICMVSAKNTDDDTPKKILI